ncbi:MAG: hypothetical protein QM708_07270 [Propioniciclava sp.]|uniref:hypothetical protein n=1 Tax=Propioniciclava sp. TaxID=2038686 RepID=UPI0039E45229
MADALADRDKARREGVRTVDLAPPAAVPDVDLQLTLSDILMATPWAGAPGSPDSSKPPLILATVPALAEAVAHGLARLGYRVVRTS